MIRFFVSAAITLFAFGLEAQTITDKNMSTGAAASYGESNFKRAPKRVYISGFRVNFHVTASNTSATMDSKTSMTVALDGVDEPDFKKLTDEAYAAFVSDLKSKGFEIISADEAAKTEYYAGWTLKTGGGLSSSQMKGYVSATPTGYKYLIKTETAKGKEKTTFVDISNKLSRELGAATIINVEFNFPLIEMDDSKSGVFGYSSVSAKINFQMSGFMRFISSEKMGKDAVLNLVPKGNLLDIEAPVFKEKKLREQAVAVRQTFGYLQYITEVERTVTHLITADHDLYVSESGRLMNEYLKYGLEQFNGYASK
jgi:hypothetical protein